MDRSSISKIFIRNFVSLCMKWVNFTVPRRRRAPAMGFAALEICPVSERT